MSPIEQSDLFQQLDAAINRHDSDGDGPLRKGEEIFSWIWVQNACRMLMTQYADCRVGIWQLRAMIATQGLAGAAQGAKDIVRLLNLPAEQLTPKAMEDESSTIALAIPLSWLSGRMLIELLQQSPAVSVKDIPLGTLLASQAEVNDLHPAQLASVRACLESVRHDLAVIRDFVNGSETEWPQDPGATIEWIESALLVLPDVQSVREAATASVPSSSYSDPEYPAIAAPAKIVSRGQVETALDAIEHYYRIHEPGHPAPVFIRRLKRMVHQPFENLLKELFANHQQLLSQIEAPPGN
ncbi:type VI secretion system protein TssA [Paraburkholderia susongensis]|uniref:Type VI secretion system protein ImpA n=1 Tax=Paraburkholderia susongensis TaxID=1515439 RepID=A0A1X7M4Y9_9BURK|nr:type VI secretion system ImpA family N-terminal domain-containing protein [Paraburkholderia susongensis]SMG61121.1 type VI secretion system protein ImpA [Paraburkholderia susongensis]